MKWFDSRLVAVAVASAFLIAGPACSEDVDGNDEDNQNAGVQDDTGDDDADAGDPNDADGPEDANNGEDVNVEDPDANDNNNEEEFPDVDPVECAYQANDDDPDCEEGDFGPASFLSRFEIADDPGEPCCFDLTGDSDDESDYDNLIGHMVVPAVEAGLPGFEDVNDSLRTSLETGNLTYLLEATRWEHPQWDEGLNLNVYRGGDADDMDDALAGNGTFWLAPDAVDDDGNPRFGFSEAQVRDGELEASDGTVEIGIPALVEGLTVRLNNVQLRGDISQSPAPDLTADGDFAINDGEMGGVVVRDDFYLSMNELAQGCPCIFEDDPEYDDYDEDDLLDLDPWEDGIFHFVPDDDDPNHPGNWHCLGKEVGSACEDDPQPQCRTLGDEQFCSILGAFSNEWDVPEQWHEDDDEEVGYSIGIRFQSVATDIEGIDD